MLSGCTIIPTGLLAPGRGASLALGRRVHPELTQAVCLHLVSFCSDILESNSCCQREQSPQQCRASVAGGEEKGKRWEFGWGRVVEELCGAYVVPSEKGRMLAGSYPSCCSGI